jgi:hypothetical protein
MAAAHISSTRRLASSTPPLLDEARVETAIRAPFSASQGGAPRALLSRWRRLAARKSWPPSLLKVARARTHFSYGGVAMAGSHREQAVRLHGCERRG